jgi:hypothetical protein
MDDDGGEPCGLTLCACAVQPLWLVPWSRRVFSNPRVRDQGFMDGRVVVCDAHVVSVYRVRGVSSWWPEVLTAVNTDCLSCLERIVVDV